MKRPTISLCMIALNEAECIGRCLRRLRPFVDEMIVVDGGSRDRTVAIAERLGVRVVHAKWRDHFARQRNIGLKHATGGWILQADPDETFTLPLLRSLRRLVRQAGLIDAYEFRENHYLNRKFSTQTKQIKLFRNRPAIRFKHRIHEVPVGFRLLACPTALRIEHWKTAARQDRQNKYYWTFPEQRQRIRERQRLLGRTGQPK